jgi:hypothetical protein
MAAQVAAGADVLLAPTFLTHRRALMDVGESRRAREWTLAAVQVGREAAELGLERREEATDPLEVARNDILVLGVLPDLDAEPEPGTGRLAPREAATERDEADQAGILADASVDAILVEPRASSARAGASVATAAATGVDVWASIVAGGREPFEAWLELVLPAQPAAVVLHVREPNGSATVVDRVRRDAAGTNVVVIAVRDVDSATAREWLGAGASAIGRLDGATPAALQPLVEARRLYVADQRRQATEASERWDGWVREAARRAPGGAALWLGDAPARMPAGFRWTVVPADALRAVPDDAYRLVVANDPVDPAAVTRVLERGGIAVTVLGPDEPVERLAREGIETLEVDTSLRWMIGRRQP